MRDIVSPLAGFSSPFGQRRDFSPFTLFAGGEEGVWYDPSDLTTLFQDVAGTTPVTTPGQTVALMLDKSKGLTLGAELVTNGTFDTDTSGWTAGTSMTLAAVDGDLRIQRGAAVNQNNYTSITTAVGKTYEIKWAYKGRSAGSNHYTDFRIGSTIGGIDNYRAFDSAASEFAQGQRAALFVATATTSYITIVLRDGVSGDWIEVDNVSVRELPGYHATQSTAAARPTYQVDAGGRGYLSFDGVDDFMVTPTITPGTDKAQVFAGITRVRDQIEVIFETSVSSTTNDGTIALAQSGIGNIGYRSKGTTGDYAQTAVAINSAFVASGIADISADSTILRIDGTQVATSATDQGTGNYLAYPMYIGRRAGTSLPYNGQIYSLITRFGPNLDTTVIGKTETYVAKKTGVQL